MNEPKQTKQSKHQKQITSIIQQPSGNVSSIPFFISDTPPVDCCSCTYSTANPFSSDHRTDLLITSQKKSFKAIDTDSHMIPVLKVTDWERFNQYIEDYLNIEIVDEIILHGVDYDYYYPLVKILLTRYLKIPYILPTERQLPKIPTHLDQELILGEAIQFFLYEASLDLKLGSLKYKRRVQALINLYFIAPADQIEGKKSILKFFGFSSVEDFELFADLRELSLARANKSAITQTIEIRSLSEVLESIETPQQLLDKLWQDLAFKYYGRQDEKLILYLICFTTINAQLDRNFGIFLSGDPGVGKSSLVKTVLNLFPDDVILPYTYFSKKYFAYLADVLGTDEIRGKIIFLHELNDMDKTGSDLLRVAITEGEIEIGSVETVFQQKRGVQRKLTFKNCVFITTTIKKGIEAQLQDRLLKLELTNTDELIKNGSKHRWNLIYNPETHTVDQKFWHDFYRYYQFQTHPSVQTSSGETQPPAPANPLVKNEIHADKAGNECENKVNFQFFREFIEYSSAIDSRLMDNIRVLMENWVLFTKHYRTPVNGRYELTLNDYQFFTQSIMSYFIKPKKDIGTNMAKNELIYYHLLNGNNSMTKIKLKELTQASEQYIRTTLKTLKNANITNNPRANDAQIQVLDPLKLRKKLPMIDQGHRLANPLEIESAIKGKTPPVMESYAKRDDSGQIPEPS